MKGRIKKYNSDRGFGFIEDLRGDEYFFHKNNWWDNSSIQVGLIVRFNTKETKKGVEAIKVSPMKGAKAEEVKIEKSITQQRRDDRVHCPKCFKKIVPRMVFSNGQPHKTVCPYCAAEVRRFTKCFIATAVYQDPDCFEIEVLRSYRDDMLEKHKLGRAFIKYYYKLSPPIAAWLVHHQKTSKCVRLILDLIVKRITKFSKGLR